MFILSCSGLAWAGYSEPIASYKNAFDTELHKHRIARLYAELDRLVGRRSLLNPFHLQSDNAVGNGWIQQRCRWTVKILCQNGCEIAVRANGAGCEQG